MKHNEENDLTKRQIEIVKLYGKGLTAKEIGRKLFISYRTVEMHRKNAIKRLKAKNVVQLVLKSIKLGYSSLDDVVDV